MLDFYFKDPMEIIDYSHLTSWRNDNPDFHLHEKFEIYFFISGNLNYFIEKKVYKLKYGDLFIINSSEIHKPYFLSKGEYERIVIHFDPAVARLINSPQFDLLNCFTNRPKGELNKINLNKTQVEDFLKLLNKIEIADKIRSIGYEVLRFSHFIELLVFINKAFLGNKHLEEQTNVPEKLIPILDFIDDNLGKELSLAVLEGKFFINRFYLSRLFKKTTGISIHEYILFKRISKAKELLSGRLNVTEVHQAVGFNDYSNFIRAFKKIVGVSPGRYKKSLSG